MIVIEVTAENRRFDKTLQASVSKPYEQLSQYLLDVGTMVEHCDEFIELEKRALSPPESEGMRGDCYLTIFTPNTVGIISCYDLTDKIILTASAYLAILDVWRIAAVKLWSGLPFTTPVIANIVDYQPTENEFKVMNELLMERAPPQSD